MSRTDHSYRVGLFPEQGVGIIENTGAGWLFPEARTGTVQVFDDSNQEHQLVLDNNTGKFYDISSREGPTNSGITKLWKDKMLTNGTGGTDIISALTFGEDTGNFEHYFIEHLMSHVYIRPYLETNRNQSGYDANGYPVGLTFDSCIYRDGNPTTTDGILDDIPLDGDLQFKTKAEGHRLHTKLTSNMGNHLVVGRQQYYIAKDTIARPGGLVMTEDTNQGAFSLPSLWLSLINGQIIDRASGVNIGVGIACASPDGASNGISFSSAINTGINVLLSAEKAILIWYQGTIAITIGGVPITLLDHLPLVSGWFLGYADISPNSGIVVVTPTGAAKIFDMRILNNSVTEKARTYYYNDVANNHGESMIPRQ